jgi:hypothetical protein
VIVSRVLATAALAALTASPAFAQPDAKTDAQALAAEGRRQRDAKASEQALANFLAAYTADPSPRLLLDIGLTLRDLGRFADAANTYHRFVRDPASDPDRVREVAALLARLDAQLTVLAIRVDPPGSGVSIDGGPFVAVGQALVTRVRPGIHLVRARHGEAAAELPITAFEGETKDVAVTVPGATPTPDEERQLLTMPAQVDGWLITGTHYASGAGRERRVRTAGGELTARLPIADDAGDAPPVGDGGDGAIGSGAIGVVRIDGAGRGFAGGVGIAVAHRRLEGELMYLRSELDGGYLGLRVRLWTGTVRPYLAGGVPAFAYDYADASGARSTKLAVGLRAAAGVEIRVTRHLSVQGDVGYEHFFVPDDARFEANNFIPTVGVIGRL